MIRYPTHMLRWNPKAKKKYKTKKGKEKDVAMEELIIATQTMIGKELRDEEARRPRDLVEEVVEPIPQNSKKKKMRKDEMGLSKTRAHGKTPPPIKQRKGVDEMSMGSPM
jgi:hypothetical protein